MTLQGYLRAIRKSWWIVVIAVALGLAASLVYIVRSAPTYASSVTFFVNTSEEATSGLLQGSQYAQNRVNSYLQLSGSERLADIVLESTDVDLTVEQLSGSISAFSPSDTVLMTVTVTDASPAQSLLLATAISKDFVTLVKDIDPAVRLELVSGPTLNPSPVSPRKQLALALGLLFGLVTGVLIAILRHAVDSTIRDSDTLRTVTHRPVLGDIGFDSDARAHQVLDLTNAGMSTRAESFRQLRTNLSFIQAPVLVITSSVDGEGKSTIAANLALTFAQTGLKVALLEADLRRPKLSTYLGMESGAGLSNVLAGQVSYEDVVQSWGDPSFDLLAVGAIPPNPAELVSSPAMGRLLENLRVKYDLVLIDTPPLLPVTDAAAIASVADAVLLVVRAGKTRRQQVSAALRALEHVNVTVVGSVLSMTTERGPEHGDGSAYYTPVHDPAHGHHPSS